MQCKSIDWFLYDREHWSLMSEGIYFTGVHLEPSQTFFFNELFYKNSQQLEAVKYFWKRPSL